MRNLMIFSAFTLFLNTLSAQSDCQTKYDHDAIYLRTEFLKGMTFVKAGKGKSIGVFFKRLAPEFEQTPLSRPLFQKAQRNAKLAYGLNLIGLTSIVASSFLINKVGYNKNYDASVGLLIGGTLVSLGGSFPLIMCAQHQLADAVFQRNREVLK